MIRKLRVGRIKFAYWPALVNVIADLSDRGKEPRYLTGCERCKSFCFGTRRECELLCDCCAAYKGKGGRTGYPDDGKRHIPLFTPADFLRLAREVAA